MYIYIYIHDIFHPSPISTSNDLTASNGQPVICENPQLLAPQLTQRMKFPPHLWALGDLIEGWLMAMTRTHPKINSYKNWPMNHPFWRFKTYIYRYIYNICLCRYSIMLIVALSDKVPMAIKIGYIYRKKRGVLLSQDFEGGQPWKLVRIQNSMFFPMANLTAPQKKQTPNPIPIFLD